MSSGITGRNSNSELRKKANSSPAPESPPGPTQRLLLAAALFLFVSCVVFSLNLSLAFHLLDDRFPLEKDARWALCTPWEDLLPGRGPAPQNKWHRPDPSANESEPMENPVPDSVPAQPQGVQTASPEGIQVLGVGQTRFSSRTFFVLTQNPLCMMGWRKDFGEQTWGACFWANPLSSCFAEGETRPRWRQAESHGAVEGIFLVRHLGVKRRSEGSRP